MPNTILTAAAQIRAELRRHTEKAEVHTKRAAQLQSALDALVGGSSPTSNWPNGHIKASTPVTRTWWTSLTPEARAVIVAKRNATRASRKSQPSA